MDRRQPTSHRDAQSRDLVDKFALFRGENKAGGSDVQTPRTVDKCALFRGGNANLDSASLPMISTHVRHYEHLPMPSLTLPRQVGYFSERDSGRIQTFDRRELKGFRPPSVPKKITDVHLLLGNDPYLESLNLNLLTGLESWIAWDETAWEHDLRLFNWILENRDELCARVLRPTSQQCCENAEFVCSRDLLVELIACTPYNPTKEWVVHIVRCQNVFFLARINRSAAGGAKIAENDNAEQKKTGLFVTNKFVSLVTCDVGSETSPWCSPGDRLNSTARFSAIFRADLSSASNPRGHRLLFTGGVECVDETGQYMAVKASRAITGEERIAALYRYKMLSEYLRCHMMGVQRLVVGFHDSTDKLVQIGEFEVDKIPDQARSLLGSRKSWKPSVCMNFLDAFLTDLKKRIPKNDVYAVYEVRFVPPFRGGVRDEVSSGLQFKRLTGKGSRGFDYLRNF